MSVDTSFAQQLARLRSRAEQLIANRKNQQRPDAYEPTREHVRDPARELHVHQVALELLVKDFDGLQRDLAECEQRDREPAESRRRLSALFRAVPDLVSVHDRDLRVVMSNWRGYEHLPDSRKRPGVHCYEAYMDRTTPCEPCRAMEVFRSGDGTSFEYTNPADGKTVLVSLFPVPDRFGNVQLVAAHLHDTTERRRAQDALRSSEERFRAVFQGARECIFIKDTDLRYTHVNPAVTQLLQRPASEIVGRRAEDIFGRETGMQISARSRRVLSGETVEYEQVRTIRGSALLFREVWTPLRDTAGAVIGVCGISRYEPEKDTPNRQAGFGQDDYPSHAMRETLAMAMHAARSEGVVLLQGESGSGKDYLARWIHSHSQRSRGPFFSINCAALPRELAESELFGHERGAFTGAGIRKKGQFELAEGGTILLNEVGELDLALQSKLLAFLDTNSFLRVGGQKTVSIDARLMAATHRRLHREVEEGRFLKPLYYRLNIFPIDMPPLRERKDDMPVLVEEILFQLAQEMQLPSLPRIEDEHLYSLSMYRWPGNVRELRNVLERSLMLWRSRGGRFQVSLPGADTMNRASDKKQWCHPITYVRGKTLRAVHDEVTRCLCEQALQDCGGKKAEAAKALGVSRDAFYRYVKKFKIQS